MIVRRATPEDSAGIAKVHVDTWRSTYRGIVSDEVLDGLSYDDRERMWQSALTTRASDNYIYVAEGDDREIVGFVAAGAEREGHTPGVGEIYAIYLLEQHHGKGIGKQLFLRAAERLSREGYDSMMLWVLEENPTCAFYEAIGGAATRTQDIDIGGDLLQEVAYEWKSLQELTK